MLTRLVARGSALSFGLLLIELWPGRADAETQAKAHRASLGYFGESATNPGVSIGYEAALYYRRPHELIAGAHAGGYYSADPSLYGLFFYLEGGYRLNFNVGFYLEARVGLGYVNINRSQSQTLPDGSASVSPNTVSNYLMPLALGGLGWDLLPRTRVPIGFFAHVGGMGRYNSGEALSGGLLLTSGLTYQFGTQRPRQVVEPVPPPPFPVAPPMTDGPESPGSPAPEGGPGNGNGPAEPAPPLPPEPPPLPPPPTVPGV